MRKKRAAKKRAAKKKAAPKKQAAAKFLSEEKAKDIINEATELHGSGLVGLDSGIISEAALDTLNLAGLIAEKDYMPLRAHCR